ncbi:GIY-YIG nuclease family protein [Pelagibacteraceae bacterium]|jgi:putative endonuclease|nr:GIY-YIG nuclease family protein [Pelagibacteraceae bacterium]
MSFYVYMLKSKSIKPITYVGYTSDLKKRIVLHNSGKGAKFTRGRKWVLIYKEKFKSKSEAISREYYIKKNRSIRNKLKNEYLNPITL